MTDTITIRVDECLREAIVERATHESVDTSAIVRAALRVYLDPASEIDDNARAAGLSREEWLRAAASEVGSGAIVRMQRAIARANKSALALADELDAALVETKAPPARRQKRK